MDAHQPVFWAHRHEFYIIPLWPAGLIQKESLACYSVSGHRPQSFQLWSDGGRPGGPWHMIRWFQLGHPRTIGDGSDLQHGRWISINITSQFNAIHMYQAFDLYPYCPCCAGLRVPLCHLCCCKIAIGDSFLRSHVQWWMRWNEKHLPKSRSHRKSIGDTVYTVYHCRPFERNDFPTKFIETTSPPNL